MPWVESHSMYTISTSVGSAYISHPSLTYGVYIGHNMNPPIPSPATMVLPDTIGSNAHIFHFEKYILEAWTCRLFSKLHSCPGYL